MLLKRVNLDLRPLVGVYSAVRDYLISQDFLQKRVGVLLRGYGTGVLPAQSNSKNPITFPTVWITQTLYADTVCDMDSESPLRTTRTNMPSARLHPNVVQEYLDHKCHEDRVIGPLAITDHPEVHVSRFGVIPKKHQPNKWRSIYLTQTAIVLTTAQLYSMKYTSIDDASSVVNGMHPRQWYALE